MALTTIAQPDGSNVIRFPVERCQPTEGPLTRIAREARDDAAQFRKSLRKPIGEMPIVLAAAEDPLDRIARQADEQVARLKASLERSVGEKPVDTLNEIRRSASEIADRWGRGAASTPSPSLTQQLKTMRACLAEALHGLDVLLAEYPQKAPS